MKIKFEFTEEMRLKAYYALQLVRLLNPDVESALTFEQYCNVMAEEAFVAHLNLVVDNLNCILERSLQNVQTSDEKS